MNKKPYLSIDVNIFREILKNKFCSNDKVGISKKILLEIIQKINNFKITIPGLNINKNKFIDNINYREYGFKEKSDIKFKFIEDIFNNSTIIILIPKQVYELEDFIELPYPINNKQRLYIAFLSDTFERLKIKAENILETIDNINNIELYAKKNIQKITRIFYEAKTLLKKTQKHREQINIFFIYVQTIFIINTILYLQKIFSQFHKEKNFTKKELKLQLCDSIGIDLLREPRAAYGNKSNDNSTENLTGYSIIWKAQVNILITFFYDIMELEMIDKNPKLIENFIYNSFRNKNGNRISKNTIRICLQEYREDKRAKGSKRIDVNKYLN